MSYEKVIKFWFEESTPEDWFKKDENFDNKIKSLFLDTYNKIVNGETTEWRTSPEGRLAEIIVLDQFSRNMFRDKPEAFENDELALSLAQEAVKVGDDQKLPENKRRFIYMPYMHSESGDVHEEALKLFKALGGDVEKYEIKHKEIIDKFGRYPHRNKILERESTPEEIEFLKDNPGF